MRATQLKSAEVSSVAMLLRLSCVNCRRNASMKDAFVEEFKSVWGVYSIEFTNADVAQGCGRICQSDGEVVRMVLNLLSLVPFRS